MTGLFDTLTRIIAHPHTTVTGHDRQRAAAALLLIVPGEETRTFLDATLSEEDWKCVKVMCDQFSVDL